MDEKTARKISRTMRRKKLDNFRAWREQMKAVGGMPASYPSLPRGGDLAEYIGVVLGDGHIQAFPRCERLIISANSNNAGFVRRYARLTRKLFGKRPYLMKVPGVNNIRISLYQKQISKRLRVPCGDRSRIVYRPPWWIRNNREHLLRFLRGLFEAEGSLSIHKPTCTYNFQFSNRNQSLLDAVAEGLRWLGFHPETRKVRVSLRRRAEVEKFRKMSRFRAY